MRGSGATTEIARWIAAALSLSPTLALAQPAPARWRLDWTRVDGAESCPSARAMEDRVRGRLGRDPFDSAGAMSIEAVVERDEGEWVAHLFARDGAAGSRELRSPDERCDALAEMAALAMALVIDPSAPLSTPTPAAPSASSTSSAERAAERPFRPARSPLGQVTVEAVAMPGALPGLAAGVGLGAQVPLARVVRVDLGAWLFPEARTEGRDVVAFSAVTGRLGACATFLTRRRPAIDLDLCAGATLGWISVVIEDPARYASVNQGARWSAQLGAWGAFVWRPVGPFVLRVEVGAMVPLVRPTFGVEGRDGVREVFQAWAVVPWIALGPGLRF